MICVMIKSSSAKSTSEAGLNQESGLSRRAAFYNYKTITFITIPTIAKHCHKICFNGIMTFADQINFLRGNIVY